MSTSAALMLMLCALPLSLALTEAYARAARICRLRCLSTCCSCLYFVFLIFWWFFFFFFLARAFKQSCRAPNVFLLLLFSLLLLNFLVLFWFWHFNWNCVRFLIYRVYVCSCCCVCCLFINTLKFIVLEPFVADFCMRSAAANLCVCIGNVVVLLVLNYAKNNK